MMRADCIDCGQPKARPRNDSDRCRSCEITRRHRAGLMRTTPRDRVTLICAACDEPFEVIRSRAGKGRACSRACNDALKRRVVGEAHPLHKPKIRMACEVCGTVCEVKPSLVERFRFCSRRCIGAWVSAHNPRVSKPERIVAERLTAAGIPFIAQERVGRYVPDFRAGNVLIEVDGTYWHALPAVVERDRRKNHAYLRAGYCVLRIPESAVAA